MAQRTQILACYDVDTTTSNGRKRLRKLAKVCESYGQRVQYSVFELSLDPLSMHRFLERALGVIDQEEDSLRLYKLGGDRDKVVSVYGRDGWVDYDGPLIT